MSIQNIILGMDTILLHRPGEFRFAQTTVPSGVPAGHALVRVGRVGICGTDWHAYHGKNPFLSYPRILGHELGVVVEQVNDPASPLRPGDRCAVEPYLNCGRCIACRRGKTNCCATLQCLGVHTDGGMRERIVVPASKLHRSESLSLDQLALIETLTIGCHGVNRAALDRGEHVLVIGAGPIGLSVIPFAQAAGAEVIVADISEARLDFCRRHLGVARTIDARGDLLKSLQDMTSGELPTAIFDATGSGMSMSRTFDLIAPGGKIVFLSIFNGEVTFADPNLHRREITVLASRNSTAADFAHVLRLVESGTLDTRPWITHRASARDLPASVPGWLKPDSGLVKAVVEF